MAQVDTALTMALLHAMETTHEALMTMWSGGHMMTCHDHVVSSVSYYKSCNEQQTNVKSSNHVNHSHSHYLVPFHVMIVIVSIIRVNSHVATLDFRNTFQIVSSQRQKGKAKKKLSSDPTQLNPNERNTVTPTIALCC